MGRSFFVGAASDPGNVRKLNEDRILVKIGEAEDGEFGLFAVADGMGGLAAGDTASELAVKALKEWWDNSLASLLSEKEEVCIELLDSELDQLILNINKRIIEYSRKLGCKSGTTLSLIVIMYNRYLLKHIGDSRVYIIGSKIRQLTEDHTWVAQQIKQGYMTPDEARRHPEKNLLTQCLGVSENIEIFSHTEEVQPDDILLLCSDGFYNLMDEYEIFYNMLKIRPGDNRVIQDAVSRMISKVKERGAGDNVSLIAVYQDKNERKTGLLTRLLTITNEL